MDRVTDQHGDAEDTVLRPGVRGTASRSVRAPIAGDVEDTVLGHPTWARGAEEPDTGDTVLVAPRRPEGDGDDDTVLRGGARPSWASSPAAPAPPAPAPDAIGRRVHALRVAGAVHRLDRPVVLGRRPAGARVPRGPEPQLVAVPSPTGEVSSTHLDVRQEGDVVVVTDLRSTNGTRVSAPGRPPVVLRQGESLVVLAGSLVDLGDGVVVEVLPPQRLTLEEGSRP